MIPSSPRLKRTPPERVGPIRSPMTSRSRTETEAGAPRDPFTAAGAVVYGALENGVRTAYAVIDEYMRRGQNTARATFNDSYKRGPMNDDRGNFGSGYNPWNPMEMFTEQWMTAMRMWSQAWSSFVPGMWQQPGMNPFAAGGASVSNVSVSVSSTTPVEVAMNLYPGLDLAGLISEPLRAEDSRAAPIDPALIAREPGAVRVKIAIAPGQPAGRYRGLIRRETDKSIAGELTVTIS
jgi:hypothetical protein